MKKTFCILGNCQANAIASTLQVCAEFKQAYKFLRVTPIHRISPDEHSKFLKHVLPEIDLFLYQPISDKFRGGGFGFDSALQHLPSTATVLSYPSIQFYGYHASSKPLPNLPDEARSQCRSIFGLSGSELFHFSQLIVAYLRKLPINKACEAFHEGFAGDLEFVQQRCLDSLNQLRLSEERYKIDARLHHVISEGFRDRQLFWSPRHPSGELLKVIADYVLNRLEISPTEEERCRFVRRDPLGLPRYPMQDFIRRALNLRFEPISEFKSKLANMNLPEMVEAYYSIYESLGTSELIDHSRAAFTNLPSLTSESIKF